MSARSAPRVLVALRTLAWSALFSLAPAETVAQSGGRPAPALRVARLAGPIALDGRVDEPAWDAVEPLPVTMHVPTFGAPPTERTEFRIAYDDHAIYASCRSYDSEPGAIQSATLQRDAMGLNSDMCTVQLDTFNDEETALSFGTTPAGIRSDVEWTHDGNAPGNFSWNTFWDAATYRDERGWYAEIRIPLSSLRFQDQDADGRVVMGVSMFRVVPRKNEIIVYPAIDNRWGRGSLSKASQYRDAVFEGIHPSRPVYVTPYTRAGRSWGWDSTATRWEPVDRRSLDVGGDAKYALASNLTLDLTVNTDFAQAEADDQQVNLTRFPLYFPEKRLFFQERGETFAFPVGGRDRLFHSRRVGLVRLGPGPARTVPILAGARLVGRIGEWDVGALDMQTDATSFSRAENLGVLRLRRRVLNENSYLGGIVTSRLAGSGRRHNVLYGLDGIVRVTGQDYVSADWAQVFEDDGTAADAGVDTTRAVAPIDRALVRLFWERRGLYGLTYSAELARVGRAFDPGLGFLTRPAGGFDGYARTGASTAYGWRAGPSSPLLRSVVGLQGTLFTRAEEGTVESVDLTARGELVLKTGHTLTAELVGSYDDPARPFPVGDVVVEPGSYRFLTGRLVYVPPSGHLLRAGASLMAGGFYGGRRVVATVSPSWFASRHLELGGTYQIQHVTFPMERTVDTHVVSLRTRVMLNARISAAALLQLNSLDDRVGANIRVRYNPREGHDLWLVWNETLRTDRDEVMPLPPLSAERVLILKYSRTLVLGG